MKRALWVIVLASCDEGPRVQMEMPAVIRQSLTNFDALQGRLDLFYLGQSATNGQTCATLALPKASKTVALDVSQATIDVHLGSLTAGEYVVMITFEDKRKATGTTLPLLQACSQVAVAAGKATVAPINTNGADAGFDENQNGLSNLEDIVAGLDPEGQVLAWQLPVANLSYETLYGLSDGTILYSGFDSSTSVSVFGGISASGSELWQQLNPTNTSLQTWDNFVLDSVSQPQRIIVRLLSQDIKTGANTCALVAIDPLTGMELWPPVGSDALFPSLASAPGGATMSAQACNGMPPAAIAPDGGIWVLVEQPCAGGIPQGVSCGANQNALLLARVNPNGATVTPFAFALSAGGGRSLTLQANTWIGSADFFYLKDEPLGCQASLSTPGCLTLVASPLSDPSQIAWQADISSLAATNNGGSVPTLTIAGDDSAYGLSPNNQFETFSAANAGVATSVALTLTSTTTLFAPGESTTVSGGGGGSTSLPSGNPAAKAAVPLDASDIMALAGSSLYIFGAAGAQSQLFNVDATFATGAGGSPLSPLGAAIGVNADGPDGNAALWILSSSGKLLPYFGGTSPSSNAVLSGKNIVFVGGALKTNAAEVTAAGTGAALTGSKNSGGGSGSSSSAPNGSQSTVTPTIFYALPTTF